MTEHADVPPEIVAELRSACLGLPEAYEEDAWIGTRWSVRRKTFAHVVTVVPGWPPVYVRAMATTGVAVDCPTYVLTFRSSGDELDALSSAGHPYFRPSWAPNVVGMILDLDAGVDWGEVAELVTESYCVLAPRKLVELVDRPTG